MHARVNIIVTGRVQGVFFRAYTRDEAQRLGIKGWVRNRRDGSVEIEAEGEREQLEKLIKWCHKGSPYARVEDVKVSWKEYKGEFQDFRIAYTY